MNGVTALERGPQGTLETILQVQIAAPRNNVRKQISEQSRVLSQQCVQVKRTFCRHQLVEAYLMWLDLCPLFQGQVMRRVRAFVSDLLENHKTSIPEELR